MNVFVWNYRFKKLDEGESYSALILAAAGVKRMGWENRISQVRTFLWRHNDPPITVDLEMLCVK